MPRQLVGPDLARLPVALYLFSLSCGFFACGMVGLLFALHRKWLGVIACSGVALAIGVLFMTAVVQHENKIRQIRQRPPAPRATQPATLPGHERPEPVKSRP